MSTEAIDEQMYQMNAAVSVAAAQPDVELPQVVASTEQWKA